MALLTRQQILAADDLKTELVPVPEWGGTVLVRALSGSERDAFEQDIVTFRREGKRTVTDTDLHNVRAKLAVHSIVDESGARLFSIEDIEALGSKSAAALQRVFDVAQRLSGLSDDDVEELAKNSGAGPSAGSTSD